MRDVYYSLVPTADGSRERQWIQSVRSLRQYDDSIPLHLCVYGDAGAAVNEEAAQLEVAVHILEPYERYLAPIVRQASVLARYPTLHKVLSLRHLPLDPKGQVLFLDCDTFFFGPVGALFESYAALDSYAREEPLTRRSRHSADPAHVDEPLLEVTLLDEGLGAVVPFNSGVWILNNGSWQAIDRSRAFFLDTVWRLLCGRHAARDDWSDAEAPLRTDLARTMSTLDYARRLRYPSRNGWIVEQVALWFTVARAGLSQGVFAERDVRQDGEFDDALRDEGRPVVAHYFSTLEDAFFGTVAPLHA